MVEGDSHDNSRVGLGEIDEFSRWLARRMLELAEPRGAIVERSLAYHHTQDPAAILKWVRDGGVETNFYYVSYGDEIGLHEAAGGLLGILEVAFESGAIKRRKLRENLGLIFFFQALDDVGGVVGLQLANGLRQQFVRQRLGELIADPGIKL